MQTDIKGHSISPLAVTLLVFIIGLGALIYSILFSTWDITAYVFAFPFFPDNSNTSIKKPFAGVCFLFTFNYFSFPGTDTQGSGLSVWYDVATVTPVCDAPDIYSYHQQGKIAWKYTKNILTFGGLYMGHIYAAEIMNQQLSRKLGFTPVESYTVPLSCH